MFRKRFLFTSWPLKKARSRIGADRDSGLTRPRLYPPPMDATPLLAFNQVRTKVNPPGICHPHGKCHPSRCGVWRWQWRQRSTLAFGAKSLVSHFPEQTGLFFLCVGATQKTVTPPQVGSGKVPNWSGQVFQSKDVHALDSFNVEEHFIMFTLSVNVEEHFIMFMLSVNVEEYFICSHLECECGRTLHVHTECECGKTLHHVHTE